MRLPLSVLTATAAIALPATLASAQSTVGTSFAGDVTTTVAASYAIYAPAGSDYARGRAALSDGDYPRAVALLTPLADGSMNPELHMLAGYARLGTGALDQAERHFSRASGLAARDPVARLGLGLVAVARGHRAAAQSVLADLERTQTACGSGCKDAARIDNAVDALRRALG